MMIGTSLSLRTRRADLPAVHMRHHEVENQQVQTETINLGQRLLSIAGRLHPETFVTKIELDELHDMALVVGN